jgi:transcriptional regulator with XRE-family HTH domain
MAKRIVTAIDRHVAAQIRIQRKARGLSQTELGKALGVSYQQIQKYENGKNRLGASRLQQIANVLDVAPDFFFEGESARVLGSSGAKETALIQDFISSRDGIHLSKAFLKISDAKMRRSIVALVKQIAGI